MRNLKSYSLSPVAQESSGLESGMCKTSKGGHRMTKNQIEYVKYKEDRRANRAKERENERSNRARESETARSNRVRERQTDQRNQIDKDLGYATVNQRENASVRDNDTRRAQLSSEDWARRANVAETQRSNLARENENYRSNVSREAENTRSAMARENENRRHNLASEDDADRKLAVESLLKLPVSLRHVVPSIKSFIPDVSSVWKGVQQ